MMTRTLYNYYFHTYDDYSIMYEGILNHKTTKIVRDRDTNLKWYLWINFIYNRLISIDNPVAKFFWATIRKSSRTDQWMMSQLNRRVNKPFVTKELTRLQITDTSKIWFNTVSFTQCYSHQGKVYYVLTTSRDTTAMSRTPAQLK